MTDITVDYNIKIGDIRLYCGSKDYEVEVTDLQGSNRDGDQLYHIRYTQRPEDPNGFIVHAEWIKHIALDQEYEVCD